MLLQNQHAIHYFFSDEVDLTFLVSITTIQIIELGEHNTYNPHNIIVVPCIQLKLTFGLQCLESELLVQTSLTNLLILKHSKNSF
jgi:hypothetical protein